MSMQNDFTAFLEKAAACPAYEKREEPTIKDVAKTIDQIADAFEVYKAESRKTIDWIETRVARPGWNTGMPGAPDTETQDGFTTTIEGRRVPLLGKSARIADHYPKSASVDFSIAEFVRDAMLGSRKAVSSGPALVPDFLSAQIIDKVRFTTAVVNAGAGTLVINGPSVLARIAGDPVVYQHTEGVEDIFESEVDLEPVPANPKLLVALVPLTEEVVSDSPNLDAALRMSLAGAFADKIDQLSFTKILGDAAIPTSAVGQDPSLWAKCLEAIGALMGNLVYQPLPGAMITSHLDFIARASQLASTAGSWLGKPPALAGLSEYPTPALAAGTAIFGGFDTAFAIAIRQEMRLEVVRWNKPGKATHLLVAHMRAEPMVLQPNRLFIMKKTVP